MSKPFVVLSCQTDSPERDRCLGRLLYLLLALEWPNAFIE